MTCLGTQMPFLVTLKQGNIPLCHCPRRRRRGGSMTEKRVE